MGKAVVIDVKTSEDKSHAEFSASGSERWLNCPASISLSKNYPEPPESEAAREGTEAHACLEFLLRNRNNLTAAFKMARKTHPEEMVEYCYEAALYILKRHKDEGGDLLIETEVDASPFTCPDQFGTLDAAVVNEFGRLIVIDFKYGAGIVVEPKGKLGLGNSQLCYYALGISHTYHHNFVEVELVVIQPRAFHESGETIRSHVMTMEDLLSWGTIFQAGVKKARGKNPQLKSGTWCKYCPVAIDCSELKEESFKNAQIAFDDVKEEIVSLPKPEAIPEINLPKMLAAIEKIEVWADAVKTYAYHMLTRGHAIEGWKLVQKRATRKWGDPDKVAEEARALFNEMAFDTKMKTPAQMEKLFPSKSDAEKWVKARTVAESSGFTMVPESDKRSAVRSLDEVFKDV